MKKPSIFSKDYEKKMKRRKRLITVGVITIFLMLGFLAAVITTKSYDFTNLRNKIQAWIDSGESEPSKEEIEEVKPEELQEEIQEAKNIEIKITNNRVIKCSYEDNAGKIIFQEIKGKPEDVEVVLSPNKEKLLVVDEVQNVKLFNTNGEETDLTKNEYIAPSGEKFEKNKTLELYKEYFWSKEARFINDNKIAYISNMPYFGYDLSKYIWIIDLESKEHKTLWNSKGKEIKLIEIKEKGLEVSIDNNLKYIDNNGDLIN